MIAEQIHDSSKVLAVLGEELHFLASLFDQNEQKGMVVIIARGAEHRLDLDHLSHEELFKVMQETPADQSLTRTKGDRSWVQRNRHPTSPRKR